MIKNDRIKDFKHKVHTEHMDNCIEFEKSRVKCAYLNELIDEGLCYDIQMISGGYILPSALPELKINKASALECCASCPFCSLKPHTEEM